MLTSLAKWISVSALLALGGRLVVVLCEDLEGIDLSASWAFRDWLLFSSAVGVAVTLTLGNALLAHQIATIRSGRAPLAVLWCGSLLMTSAILAPDVRAALVGATIGEVLSDLGSIDALDLYSILYVFAPEYIAGVLLYACRLEAAAQEDDLREQLADAESRLVDLTLERDRLALQVQTYRAEKQQAAQKAASRPRLVSPAETSFHSPPRPDRQNTDSTPQRIRRALEEIGWDDSHMLGEHLGLTSAAIRNAVRRVEVVKREAPSSCKGRVIYALSKDRFPDLEDGG